MSDYFYGAERNPPASDEAIRAAEAALGFVLPLDYVEFLKETNGAIGTFGGDGYIDLWLVTELVQRNEAYAVREYAPNLVIFGSDGGDTAYAFDIDSRAIVETPFIGIGIEAQKIIAVSFGGFLDGYGRVAGQAAT